MNVDELESILELHKKWLVNDSIGRRADLYKADLHRADLRRADLRRADLRRADLRRANLQEADLYKANLYKANLQEADLQGANLQEADLREANLQGADLRGADLRRANLDFSCWPLWCGSLDVKLDERIKAQLLYHTISVVGVDGFNDKQIARANMFHQVENGDCKELKR
jgi:hypothetical protein